jgi:hypothetical protein
MNGHLNALGVGNMECYRTDGIVFCSLLKEYFMSDNYSLKKKKIRGARRKYNVFANRLKHYTEYFPDTEDDTYWHIHMPCSDILLNSPKSPSFVKVGCANIIIERTKHLINIRPKSMEATKIVGVINLYNLWSSQIIIFYDTEYFNQFFQRDSEYQKWIPIPTDYKRYFLRDIKDLSVKGFKEIIKDEDYEYNGELWFVGELD